MANFSNLQGALDAAKTRASSSNTYFGAEPTSKDFRLQANVARIQGQMDAAKQASLRKEYYGDEPVNPNAPVPKPKEGFFTRGIQALQTPLYAVEATAATALGKGSTPNLFKNIAANVNTNHEGFGTLLRQEGVNGTAAGIGGFALDIALDPVNWMTMGTSALIPRVAIGAKYGAEAAGLGLKTGLLEKGLTLAKPVSWVAPKSKLAMKIGELGKGVAKDSATYDTLVGRGVDWELANKGVIGNAANKLIGAAGETELGKTIGSGYQKYLEYSPLKWYQQQKSLAPIFNLRKTFAGGQSAATDEIANIVSTFEEMAPGTMSSKFKQTFEDFKAANYNIDHVIKKNASDIIDTGVKISTDDKDLARIINGDTRLKALRDEKLDDLTVQMAMQMGLNSGLTEAELKTSLASTRSAATGTGIKWFDDSAEKIRKMTFAGDRVQAAKIIDGYKTFIDVFKTAKIGGNPATHAMSIVGNTIMAGMHGIHFWDPKFLGSVKSARTLLSKNSDVKSVAELFTNPEFRKFIEENPDVAKSVYGVDLNTLLTQPAIEDIVNNFLKPQFDSSLTDAQRKLVTDKFMQQAKQEMADAIQKSYTQGMSPLKSVLEGTQQVDTTFISNEMRSKYYLKGIENIKESADNGSKAAQVLYAAITKPMEAFEKIDQSFKLGTTMHLLKTGVSMDELKIMSRFYPLKNGTDVTLDAATGLYKFSPDAATGLVQDMFMNYAAMPAAIKALRSVPFIGSPFASFSFAMLNKGVKTAAYNPAFLNNMQFALNEINGGRSPLEKQALQKNYYSWYNKAGMVSLPFFRDNPIYLNAASFIPYLTMNIFEPSDRKYSTGVGAEAAKLLDASPFFKDPAGQVLMDYMVMPHLLRETTPTGMWGNQLWPSDATAVQKVGYAMRNVAESVVPPAAGLLGLTVPATGDKYLEAVPLYRWRQTGYATQGKSPVGIQGKESKMSRTTRAILNYAGVNLYPMNISYSKK